MRIDPFSLNPLTTTRWSRPLSSAASDPIDRVDRVDRVQVGPTAKAPPHRGLARVQSALRAAASLLGPPGIGLSGTSEKPPSEEALFALFHQGKAEEGELAHPALGRILKTEDLSAEEALERYRELTTDPKATLGFTIRVAAGEHEGRMTFGRYPLAEVEDPGFAERLAATRAAVEALYRHTGAYGLDAAWALAQSQRDHHGKTLAERVPFVAAATRDRTGTVPEVYDALLALAEKQPAERVLEYGPRVLELSNEKALQALEHLETAHPGFYLGALGAVGEPATAQKIAALRQTSEGDEAYLHLAPISMSKDVKARLLTAWADSAGAIDVRPVTDRSHAEFFANLWSRVPREEHARFCLLPRTPEFEHLEAAHAACSSDSRREAWLEWFRACKSAPVATELVSSWPAGDISPADAHDFGQVLTHHQGKPGAALEDWAVVSAAPGRDLAMAAFHSGVAEIAGCERPDQAAALRRLVEGKVGLDTALDAVALLEPHSGEKRALPELASDYLAVAGELKGDHRRTRAALRQAFGSGPLAGESLAVALKATGELSSALGLLPLVEQPERAERLANLEVAGRIVGRGPAVARLLVDCSLDAESREKLPAVIGSVDVLPRLEDYLGRRSQPEAPLGRLARAGDLLRQSHGDEAATTELAGRLTGAFGGDWSQEAAALISLGAHAEGIARELGEPAALREALPLLRELAGKPELWTPLATPVAEESLSERCAAACKWLSAFPGQPEEATRAWSALVARGSLPDVLEPGLRLRASLAPWGPESFVPAVEMLHAMREPLGPLVDRFGAALGRVGAGAVLHGLDLQSVRREMTAPAFKSGVRDEAGAVTVSGVRLRKRQA